MELQIPTRDPPRKPTSPVVEHKVYRTTDTNRIGTAIFMSEGDEMAEGPVHRKRGGRDPRCHVPSDGGTGVPPVGLEPTLGGF